MAGKTRPSLMAKTLTNVALSNLSLTDKKCIEEVFKKFEVLTSADVVEVKHGEWDVNVGMNFNKERICPICKKRIESNYWDFCSHCGAKNVDGGKAE